MLKMIGMNMLGSIILGVVAIVLFIVAYRIMQASMEVHYDNDYQYVNENYGVIGLFVFTIGWAFFMVAMSGSCVFLSLG